MTDLKDHREPSFDLPEILKSAGYVAGAGVAATVGGVVAVTTSGCCGGSSSSSSSSGSDFDYNAWAETDGAAGRINMQAVQQAFETAQDPSAFELAVNEIYEGEHPVLIRVQNLGTTQSVEGWEDLNDDGMIVDGQDDKMFTLSRGPQGTQLEGHGANSYHVHRYPPTYNPMGGMMMGFMAGSMMGYVTSPMRRSVIMSHTRTYRSSPAYASRRAANRSYFTTQRSTNPRWGASRGRVSPARSSFRSNVRSSGGGFGRSSGFGRSGVRGGGR